MPIRIRLSLWYSAIFALALLLFSLGLYGIMERHLVSMVDDAIADRMEHLVAAVRAANPNGEAAESPVTPSLDAFEAPEVYVQVLSRDGSILARSSNLEIRILPPLTDLGKQGTFDVTVDGTRMRASAAPVTAKGQTVAWIEVAVSFRQRDMVLDRLRWVLLGGGLGAIVLVGLLSAALAGRALSPVSEMTETARAIALSRGFSRRLSVSSQKDELGQLAQTFNEMLASLEEAYSAQQRFTSDASHELRAPLTAIRGNLDLLDRVKDMPEEDHQQTLQHVRREVERLGRLVNDLLTLARADAGQAQMQSGLVELDALLVEAHRQALSMSKGVGVRLADLEPAVVQGDEDRLKQLLLILVDNALRYTPEGGVVTLGLKREPPWVTAYVEDTGIGIEPEDLPRIFDRFWRADRARSRDSGGTGLGLSIAKWIVEQHGGEILVGSVPGKGSRFSVRLPASP
ncbi:MAG: HAMP domain-containing histidine kinase [Chloroflexi bacterium]|nr:HAMP domain-containing histidine kinase [Chloroflexota bacterium]